MLRMLQNALWALLRLGSSCKTSSPVSVESKESGQGCTVHKSMLWIRGPVGIWYCASSPSQESLSVPKFMFLCIVEIAFDPPPPTHTGTHTFCEKKYTFLLNLIVHLLASLTTSAFKLKFNFKKFNFKKFNLKFKDIIYPSHLCQSLFPFQTPHFNPNVQMFQCSNLQRFKCFNVPMFKYSNVPMFKYSDVPMLKCSNAQIFKYLNVQMLNVKCQMSNDKYQISINKVKLLLERTSGFPPVIFSATGERATSFIRFTYTRIASFTRSTNFNKIVGFSCIPCNALLVKRVNGV